MNIQDEIKKGRLYVDAESATVFMDRTLWGEILDTSMFPHALKVMKLAWWKRWLLWLVATFNHTKYERMIGDGQIRFYLMKLLDYVNGERIHTLGMDVSSMAVRLDFSVTEKEKVLYVGMYLKEKDEFYLRPIL
jgi:hypothetical protein